LVGARSPNPGLLAIAHPTFSETSTDSGSVNLCRVFSYASEMMLRLFLTISLLFGSVFVLFDAAVFSPKLYRWRKCRTDMNGLVRVDFRKESNGVQACGRIAGSTLHAVHERQAA
jgi:hypothetical protein